MILSSCLDCEFHDDREDGGDPRSHCRKENCWAQFSKCLALKALNRFLDDEAASESQTFSALSHVYPRE